MPFINRNVCKTFELTCNGSVQNLSAVLGTQECSEIYIRSRTTVTIFDDLTRPTIGFPMIANEELTLRGITNLSSLSANGTNGGKVYIRTQYYTSIPGAT
jgi:hypothetical protein